MATKKRGPYKLKKPNTTFVKLRTTQTDLEWAQFALSQLSMSGISAERMKQLKSWSYEHDDEHSIEDWAYFINERTEALSLGVTKKKAHKLLVEIGALAVAALEALSRAETRKMEAKELEQKKRGPKVQVIRRK